ncbi:HEAT repeat domain-containing protein [Leptospira santarosai]|uniref:HEAT repeat protein n=1 Tax=Leptospira santarosai TaxID=28183 RepID=A0AB73LL53_9LEPT|nr:HEAT repeat domain-containing protein [Leptospira santarosai]ASV12610.1 HEAT repeat domain-containing protein [Leptospira santarosai]AVV49019.1 Uncharacterized protein XB17_00404 [Leptospira santarosai]MDI7166035.1 HEAT repeat domain-containing protein [Leptospira santarosai]MDO6383953.1 HEAT repeat domain-containing protein [Leptospira santarosai]ONF91653.1 hypothetical protein BWD14_16045 [Leptospira santarosai]
MTIEEKLLFSFPFLGTLVFYILILYRIPFKTKSILFLLSALLTAIWFWFRPQYILHRWKSEPFEDSNVSILSFGLGLHAYAYEEFLNDIVFYRPILHKILRSDPDPKLRIRTALFLGYSKNESDRQVLIFALNDPQFGVRLAASLALLPREYLRSSENFFGYTKFCLLMKQEPDCYQNEKTIREFVDLNRDQFR